MRDVHGGRRPCTSRRAKRSEKPRRCNEFKGMITRGLAYVHNLKMENRKVIQRIGHNTIDS